MSGSFVLGAYWGARREDVDWCAVRFTVCMSELAGLHPLLRGWQGQGDSREEAMAMPILAPEHGAVREALLHGSKASGAEDPATSERGFRIGLWNGQEPGVALSVSCGAERLAGRMKNRFLLDLPPGDKARDLYAPDLVHSMMATVINAWEPDWATFYDDAIGDIQHPATGSAIVGWLTYRATPLSISPDQLPAPQPSSPTGRAPSSASATTRCVSPRNTPPRSTPLSPPDLLA
ncbi:Imm52 family immunity protein [Salinactinospora qingdaonensis]|uniref:Immunity protein 52 domain-containing protein n=1 Tax=Salinactinospora qingdaonensis TaxID=702744 RepID=A0ABP7FDS3_9ACTN